MRKLKPQVSSKPKPSAGVSSITTGFPDLDRITLGWQQGELILFAGRPKMGVQAFLRSMLEDLANDKNTVCIDKSAPLSISAIREKLDNLSIEADLLIIENFPINEVKACSVMNELKAIAEENKVPIIVCSELNEHVNRRKGLNGKRPRLCDLTELKSCLQLIDVVCFFYRPEAYRIIEYENGDSTIGIAEIIVAKNHGDVGIAKFGYQAEQQKFNNLAIY